MKRVEIVVELSKDHPGVQDIIEKLRKGERIKTSMGTKVPYDVCSCCGHKAKRVTDYCDHLKKEMGKVRADGSRIYAINTKPRFFDISIVTIPADPTSSFLSTFGLEKTASVEETKQAGDKSAEIEKEISGEMKPEEISADPKNLIHDSQDRLTQEQIEKLSEYPLNQTLSTFLGLRILPHKEDFQKLALYATGRKEMADELEKNGQVFDVDVSTKPEIPADLGPEHCNIKVAEEIFSDIPKFSLTKRDIINRIIEKTADLNDPVPKSTYPERDYERSFIDKLLFNDEGRPAKSPSQSPVLPMMTMGALFAGYAKLFGESANANGFTKFLGKNPWLAPIVAGGIAYGSTKLEEETYKRSPYYEEAIRLEAQPLEKQAGLERFFTNMMIATPVSYYGASKIERKAQRGEKINNAEDFVRRNPLLTAFGSSLVAGSAMKNLGKASEAAKTKVNTTGTKWFQKKAEHINSLSPEITNQIYTELIQ